MLLVVAQNCLHCTLEKLTPCSTDLEKVQILSYNIHKRQPLVSILSQVNPAHIIKLSLFTYLMFIFILTSNLRLHLPCGLFPSGFPTKILYSFSSHACM